MPALHNPFPDVTVPAVGSEVLLIEDDAPFRKRIAAFLRQSGAEVTEAGRLDDARRLLGDMRFEFALVDLHLPDGNVLDLLREGAFSENTGVVVMTAFGGVKQAVEAIRLGAGDYLSKPFEPEELPLAFARCRSMRLAARRAEHRAAQATSEAEQIFFGESLRHVRAQLDTIVATERRLEHRLPPVLIEGETGTGKSVIARWLLRHGSRAGEPFVSLNCAALPEGLAEAELFGHERGAFTDAKRARIGLFEAADGGTLFLDEIGSLAPATQAKVLTSVEEGTIRRLGGTREISIDVRLIAASNRDLRDLVRQGAFREDLYHRLNLLHVALPPLRERGTDILPLARHLLARIAARHRIKGLSISPEGEARLLAQPWRGNVRELAHEIERAVIFNDGSAFDFASLGGPGGARGGRLAQSGVADAAVGLLAGLRGGRADRRGPKGVAEQRVGGGASPGCHAGLCPIPDAGRKGGQDRTEPRPAALGRLTQSGERARAQGLGHSPKGAGAGGGRPILRNSQQSSQDQYNGFFYMGLACCEQCKWDYHRMKPESTACAQSLRPGARAGGSGRERRLRQPTKMNSPNTLRMAAGLLLGGGGARNSAIHRDWSNSNTITAVSSRAAEVYARTKLANGSFQPETYAFGERRILRGAHQRRHDRQRRHSWTSRGSSRARSAGQNYVPTT